MASILSSATKPTRGSRADEVYVAAVPLRATKGPGQLLMSTAYSFNLWDLQHFMVIIKPSSSPQSQAVVSDFQPQDPENIYVALAALSGNKVPGAILTRKLTKLPKTKCWFIGSCEMDAVDATYKFNQSWQTDLRIGHHDCRDYTNGNGFRMEGTKSKLTPPSRICFSLFISYFDCKKCKFVVIGSFDLTNKSCGGNQSSALEQAALLRER